MVETEDCGMQEESFAGTSIEPVALDGIIQSVFVGTVHTQLMGSARERSQLYAVGSYTFI